MTIVYDIILNEGHDPTPVLKGIITLEDIIEEII
jgi:Mg2+/Co2+ transporter CorB